MKLYDSAVGECAVCGEDAEGSFYWTPLPSAVWNALRPLVAHLFPPDKVQNILFVVGQSQPLCSAECSLKYHQEAA